MKTVRPALLSLIPLLFAQTICAQTIGQFDGRNNVQFDARNNVRGDEIRGPVVITVRNVNAVRYLVRLGIEVTTTPPPDLRVPFLPAFPPLPAQTPSAAPAGGRAESAERPNQRKDGPDVNQVAVAIETSNYTVLETAEPRTILAAALQTLGAYETRASQLDSIIKTIGVNASSAAKATDSFVRDSDATLGSGGIQAMAIGLRTTLQLIGGTLKDEWPQRDLQDTNVRLGNLSSVVATYIDPDVPQRASIMTHVQELRRWINDVDINSAAGNGFMEIRQKLNRWQIRFAELSETAATAFTRQEVIGCGVPFGGTRKYKVSLVSQDLLAGNEAQPIERELVTVVCSSPLSISVGFSLSAADERDFGFVQAIQTTTENGQTTQTVVSQIGISKQSRYRPLPTLLLNTRLYEPNDVLAAHFSVGAGVDINGTTGSEIELLVGPSISIHRAILLTFGAHTYRVQHLASGYNLGQQVPSSIATVPVEKGWSTALFLGFTYTIWR